MALASDASTPVAVTSNVVTLTTASFTPPSGSMLYVCIGINASASGVANSITSVTDNRASHLTYTQRGTFGNSGLNDDAVTYLYTAPVSTSAAMTVSAVQQNTTGTNTQALLRVLVVTGADSSSPVGVIGGGRGLATNITAAKTRYLATRGGSWGWLITADWAQKGIPTVLSDETVDAQFDAAGEDSYCVVKKNATVDSAGREVALSTITPASATQTSYLYFEMLPATVSNSSNSVPSGTSMTAGSLSAKFLFFDTGDYSGGV